MNTMNTMLLKINGGTEPYFNTILYDWRFVKLLMLDIFGLKHLTEENVLNPIQLNFIRGEFIIINWLLS